MESESLLPPRPAGRRNARHLRPAWHGPILRLSFNPTLYISSNAAEPFNLDDAARVPLRENARYELGRGVTDDGGLTFHWTPVTKNSEKDNLRPYVPRRQGGPPSVLWFRGTYRSYTNYDCEIVGLF